MSVRTNAPTSTSGVPQGVVTFLFTDIEGSTRRWEADGEAMRTALEAHDEVLREAIDGRGGWQFKHTGDGVCAVFTSPRAAVDAAVAAQRKLELPVRMGIATGEAQLRGDDYFGAVLNRAARVMAAGHGGQVLLDGLSAGLLTGVDLLDLGPRRLRDLAKTVEMFQVQAPGLRSDFPPLRTLEPVPGNLRAQTTSFVGRETELADVRSALQAHRLVTLTGVGGVGKTRLALEVASRVADGFPDGAWVIELAAVGDPAAVPEAVAATLGITQQAGMTLADSVAAAMEGRSRLLVFDNCEHVLDAAADLIETILAQSATVKILATSREGLRAADEQLWPVPSMETGAGARSTAATLFLERAEGVLPGVSLTDQEGAVVEICRRLDGIPLAIELAASRMQSMTVTEVRDRLDDRFRLLVGSRRGLERHQTLRHAVQWSYDLLDDTEKDLLDRCAVFAGGFDLAGACAVADIADEFATLDVLDALVRKSLLSADKTSGRTRFSMLETIRQFAEEHLVASGDADDVRTSHARFFAGREAEMLELWESRRQREAYDWVTVESANLRTAFRWSADRGDLDTAIAIAALSAFLGIWIEQLEASRWVEELIEPAKAVQHRRLAQLYGLATQCYSTGRLEDALGYGEAAREAIESGHFDEVRDETEVSLGGYYVAMGQPDRWIDLCRTVIARRPGAHTYARACLVLALTSAGDEHVAAEASQCLLAAAETTDAPNEAAFALFAYGWARRDSDPGTAYEVQTRSLAIAQDSGNRQSESFIAVSLSRIAAIRSDPDDAFDHLTLAIRNRYTAGSVTLLHAPLAILAALLDRLGRYEPAATISGFAATTLTRTTYVELTVSIAHLRDELGSDAYESLARAGVQMSDAAMVAYAFEQIDAARAEVAS